MAYLRWIFFGVTIALLASISDAQTASGMEIINKAKIVDATTGGVVYSFRLNNTVYSLVNPIMMYSVDLAAIQNNQTVSSVPTNISTEGYNAVAYALDSTSKRLIISTSSSSAYDVDLGKSKLTLLLLLLR